MHRTDKCRYLYYCLCTIISVTGTNDPLLMDSSSLADTGVIWTRSTYSPTVLTVLKNKYDFSPCFKDQSVYVYSSYSWLNFFWLRFFFFLNNMASQTARISISIWLLHAVIQAILPSFGWKREQDRVDWSNMKHLPPDWFLNQIAQSNGSGSGF